MAYTKNHHDFMKNIMGVNAQVDPSIQWCNVKDNSLHTDKFITGAEGKIVGFDESEVVHKVMSEFDNISKAQDLFDISNDHNKFDLNKEFIKKEDKRSLFIFLGTIIISLIIGLVVICIPANAAFSPEGINAWANVLNSGRDNQVANYQRQRMQQMQQEQHDLQMELLREQIDQLKKQKQRR